MPAMLRKSITRQLYTWIACFAILVNALAPSISHAMAAFSGDPATWEICRTDTSATATATPGQPDLVVVGNGKSTVDKMAHCGYCLPHGASYALMPAAITGLGIFGGHELRPFLFYRAPRPLLALSAAPPRGPPALA
jgi:hypothetical protein